MENSQQLADNLEQFRVLREEEQTLRIQDIVKQMAVLLSAVTLAMEIQHDKPPKSKEASLILFIRKYINARYCLEEEYLTLLEKVIK